MENNYNYQPPLFPQLPQQPAPLQHTTAASTPALALGKSISALIFGIFSILFCAVPLLNVITFLLAVIGIFLAGSALRKNKRNSGKTGLAVAAMVLTIVGAILCLIVCAVYVLLFLFAIPPEMWQKSLDLVSNSLPY